MATAWDKHSARGLTKLQDTGVREQVTHVLGPFSPYWKHRLAELGRTPDSISGVAALSAIPAVGERDIAVSGDPAEMAALVVQATEGGFALHTHGPRLRRALRLRLTDKAAYRQLLEHDTKPTTYVWSGLGFRFPVASTPADLDVVAKCGARLWQVLGLTGDDALLSAVPVGATTEHMGLWFAAMAAGAPGLFPGADPAQVTAAARLAAPTVLAAPSPGAAALLETLRGGGVALDRLRTVLLVGAPTGEERAAAEAAAPQGVRVRAVHAPSGARLLWGECAEGGAAAGLHTYPDHDLVQLVDPETGDPTADGGEVVLSQLGLRGSALLRWRTGDLAGGRIDASACPACRRTVPRVTAVRRGALVLMSDDGRALDLRALAGALTARTELTGWRVLIGPRPRDGRGQVLVHYAAEDDPAEVAVALAGDIRAVAGILPTQLVAREPAELEDLGGEPLTARILRRG